MMTVMDVEPLILVANQRVTMTYDMENRLVGHQRVLAPMQRVTYTYDGDGLKRSENDGTAITTLVRDGTDVLEERS